MSVLRRVANLFRRPKLDQDIDAELRAHIEMRAADNIAAGMSPEEARRQAVLRFGSRPAMKERVIAADAHMFLDSLWQDLRYALRMLRKSPGFTAVAVLTLAVGLGVNATAFSIVNGILFRGLAVPHPSGMVSFGFAYKGYQGFTSSYPDLQDVRQQAGGLVDLCAYAMGTDGLTTGNHTDRIATNYVTGNYFDVLGIKPVLGRLIAPGEVKPGSYDAVVVLSYSYWQSRFGGDPSILGKSVRLNGKPMTVVGVAQKGFQGPYRFIHAQAFLPLNAAEGAKYILTTRTYRSLCVLGRLRPGVPLSRADAAVKVVASRLAREHPKDDPDARAWLFFARLTGISPTGLEPHDVPQVLLIYALSLTLALLVLLVACFTLANLLLARAAARRHEMAVRAALGAGAGRLLKQALAETGLLAVLGCAAGLALGFWALRYLESISLNVGFGLIPDFSFDDHVFLYAVGAAILAVFLAGFAPALRASRSNPCNALHEGAQGVIGGRSRFRKALVAAQIAASVVLLVASGIAIRSLVATEETRLGFDPGHSLKLNMDPSEAGYDQAQDEELYKNLLPRIRALPGVQSAALANTYPSNGSFSYPVQAENHPIPPGQVAPSISMNSVSPGYFETLQIPILRGRAFLETDTAKSTPVAIVNEKLAQQLWPNENPIGKRINIFGPKAPWISVVGVAADSTYAEISRDPNPHFYLPASQFFVPYEILLVRTEGSPEAMLQTVEAQVRALAPAVPVFGAATMRQTLDNSFGGFFLLRLSAIMAVTVGLLGLALAIGGVYGVVSYDVGRRTHEIGIRIALGASSGSIQRIIFRQGLAILVAGLFFGNLCALSLAAVTEHVLGGFGAPDLLTYLGVAIVISAATLLACYIPARRAMRVDPMVALRYE
ncbi:MAG TPA: ABC transporter permease [Candidatus Acidoferrales bacterium]|nr:ABC transporter permease [Candidatus Acidoferrales bacterium]